MKSLKIIASGKYIPSHKVTNTELNKKFNIDEEFIFKRTGIKSRFFVDKEKIEDLATNAVKDLLSKTNTKKEEIDLIIVATTSTNNLMPGISNYIQKYLNIENCICLDILAGCSGYINAFDIAQMYIAQEKIKTAIVVGVDILSKYVNYEDLGTAIILSDGAGATLLQASEKEKKYYANINNITNKNEILTCKTNEKIYMDGIEIYKYAVTETVKSIQKILEKSKTKLEEIKYIVPHQSNAKIMKAIANRLKIEENKMYINIENIGNTFCASIPIALSEMFEKDLLQKGDKIIMLGYGGGLNTGSILIEV